MVAAASRADILTLTSGLVVEGIVRERGDKVDVQVPEGLLIYRRDVVKSIQRKASALQEYQSRRAQVRANDAEALYELGLFCLSRGMPVPAAQEFEAAIRADPKHANAHLKLGHIQDGDLWYSESDYQSHMGNVRADGQWLSRDVAAARAEIRMMESDARSGAVRAYYERLARQEAQGASERDPSACGGINAKSAGTWLSDSLWAPGQNIRVAFADGTPEQQESVRQIAPEWCRYANLTFDFAQATADTSLDDVRVSFTGTGSHSMLGRQSVAYAHAGQVTTVLNWATHSATARHWRRTVLHEFGHTLGLLHEHQNPNAKLHWNEQYVTQYLAKSGMSEAEARANVLETQGGAGKDFDPQSIMLYAMPKESNTDGVQLSWNTELSPMDKQVAAALYPGRDGGPARPAASAATPVDNRDLVRLGNATAALRRDLVSVRALLAAPPHGPRSEADQELRLRGIEGAYGMVRSAFARRVQSGAPVDANRAAALNSISQSLYALANEVISLRRERRSRG